MTRLLGANQEGTLLPHQSRRKRKYYWLLGEYEEKVVFEREMAMNNIDEL